MTSGKKEILAAVCVFLATLTHEAGIATALAISTLAILFCRRDVTRLRQLLIVFCLPVVSSLLINCADYFIIHPPPSLFAAADSQAHHLEFSEVVKFIGAIGSDLFTSPALHLKQLSDGYILWEFYNESPQLLFGMAVPVALLLVIACVAAAKEVKQDGFTHRAICLALLLSFFIAIFAVCAFRMHSRGMYYMAMATYYYGLFALALCGIGACLLISTHKSIIKYIAVTVLLLSIANVVTLRTYFQTGEKQRNIFMNVVAEGRKVLIEKPGFCFSGVKPVTITYGSMFYDVSCASRPGAKPLHIQTNEKNEFWLSSFDYRSNSTALIPASLPPALKLPANGGWITAIQLPYGHDMQFTVNRAENFTIALSSHSGSPQSITIERNLLRKTFQKQAWTSEIAEEAALDHDSASLLITYKLGFTREGLMLFANGLFVGDLPALPPEADYLTIVLRTTGKKPADFGSLYFSEHPSAGYLHTTPLFLLTETNTGY
jgi:hypothetical protein